MDDAFEKASALIADEITGCTFDPDDPQGTLQRAREIVSDLRTKGFAFNGGTSGWEYRIERVAAEDLQLSDLSKSLLAASPPPWHVGPHAETVFNDLGKEGWELVAVTSVETALVATFKRAINV